MKRMEIRGMEIRGMRIRGMGIRGMGIREMWILEQRNRAYVSVLVDIQLTKPNLKPLDLT